MSFKLIRKLLVKQQSSLIFRKMGGDYDHFLPQNNNRVEFKTYEKENKYTRS